MWNRSDLKDKAKDLLRKNYWTCFIVSFILLLVSGSGGTGGSSNVSFIRNSSNNTNWTQQINWGLMSVILIVVLIFILLVIAVRIFIGYAIEVGGRKYYIKASENKDDTNLNYIIYGFKNGYFNIIKAMLWRSIAIFLWTLLLIIPGIIKFYAYRMVPYILAENPDIGTSRALELSNDMTRGHKLNIWVLDLSFIGWYILGVLALFIGVLFVQPYVDATNGELYLALREEGINKRMCTYAELNVRRQEEIEDRY
jgi:uncharacterized membrane protein